MSLQALVEQVAEFPAAMITQLLDTAHRDALNARNALITLREDLVTANLSPDRVATKLAEFDERIAKELATHLKSMEQLRTMRARWELPPEQAQEQLAAAKAKAADAARLFNAVQKVAEAKAISSQFPPGTNFSELLEE